MTRHFSTEPIQLALGPMHCLLAPAELSLKKLTWHGQLLVEAVYVAVRDENWDTGQIRLTGYHISTRPSSSVNITLDAQIGFGTPSQYTWRVEFNLSEHELHCYADGRARQTFLRNRIGICVLLPASLAGIDYAAQHGEGSTTKGILPKSIAPHQPVLDIAKLQINAFPNKLNIAFSGEVFEMEDQRNWTDASYKIYGTPLARKFPVQVSKGESVSQKVELSWSGQVKETAANSVFDATWSANEFFLPQLGLRYHTSDPLEDVLVPDYLQGTLDLSKPETLLRQIEQLQAASTSLKRPIEMVLSHPQLVPANAIVEALMALPLKRLILLANDPNDISANTCSYWKAALSNTPLLVGSLRYFAEVNRASSHLRSLPVDGLAYSVSPQVHAFDDLSIFDTLPIQALTIQQALTIKSNVAFWSVTLHPLHFSGEDKRLHTDLGAAWWLASFIQVIRAGANSATYFALGGVWGVADGSPLQKVMRAVLRAKEVTGYATLLHIGEGSKVDGLAIGSDIWLVNASDTLQVGILNSAQVWLKPYEIRHLSGVIDAR